jgi:hypothetical protein
MSKTEPTDVIKNLHPGQKDPSGNNIVHILATSNEYCIYEIDHPDINYRLRIQIDGKSDESEEILVNKYNKVKQKYIEAKGLLYRSQNYGMMKNRVAQTLATCLSSDSQPNGTEFDDLINTIKDEQKEVLYKRMLFILPSILLTLICGIICFLNLGMIRSNYQNWQILIVLFSALLGSSLSILSRTKEIYFEEHTNKFFYFILGFERIFLACVVGTIAYILIRSKILFSQFENYDYWKIMTIVICTSFSERLIPSSLEKINLEKK